MRSLPWVLLLIVGGIVTLMAIVVLVLIDKEPTPASQNQSPAKTLLDEQADKACGLPSSEAVAAQEKVSIQAHGFTPKEVTIKVGQTVRWINNDSGQHRIYTDVHPLHDECFGFHSDSLSPGDSYGYTFTKPGTWRYHDEAALSNQGVIIVTE